MKKLLLILVALFVAFGWEVQGADIVETFESFTDAKQTWLPTTQSATATDYTSTITKLTWTVENVNAAKNTGKIYMTFKKDVDAYMATTPGIVCDKISINVGFAGQNGGMSVYVGESEIAHKDITQAGDYTFDIPTNYQNTDTKFKIVNNHKVGATKGNQISVMSITFKEATGQQPVKLGELTGVYGSESTSIAPETPVTVEEGTKFIFKADNATKMSIACGEDILSTEEGSELEWISDVRANSEMTVTASLNGEEKTLKFTLTSTEKPKVLGDIVVTYGDGINVENGTLEGLSVQTGTTFYISATNATHISAKRWSDETVVVDVDADNASWTFNEVQEMDGLTITATNGVDTKTFEFLLEITEAPKPVLGNLVVTYGDGIQVNEDDEISVEVGTTFTFSAENATNINVESFMESLVVVNENASSATWTPESAFAQDGFTVTATDGTDSKTLTFLLTVTEPVKPANEFVKVTSLDQLNEANTYVIIGTSGGVFYGAGKNSLNAADASGNNRQAYVVSVANDKATVDLDKVDVFSLVKNGDNWYIKTGTGMYLNNSDEADKNKLLTEETPQDVAISLTTQKNATIQFLNGKETSRAYLRFNSANSSGPIFGCYVASGQNSVALYYKEGEVVSQPEVPIFDQMEEVATKVSMTSTKGELHVWTMEYDKDGKLVKENGEEMPVSIMAKAPADDKTWTNKVADEGVTYEIDVPTTDGNYLTIRAKSVLNGLHSEELVKNVDASGNVISGVEGVVADDENAPVEYFNLQGVRVAADQPGIYIRRQGSKVEKVSIAR